MGINAEMAASWTGSLFFAYYTGVSHGRAPYKLAAIVQAAKAAVISKNATEKHLKIDEKGVIANEST